MAVKKTATKKGAAPTTFAKTRGGGPGTTFVATGATPTTFSIKANDIEAGTPGTTFTVKGKPNVGKVKLARDAEGNATITLLEK
jgi:hypothetical protein